MQTQQLNLYQYKAWDLPVRLFHWINFTAIIALMLIGLIMLFKKDLGITSIDAKIGLKVLHVTIGYVFVTNLLIRIVWGFIGSKTARWHSLVPSRTFADTLRAYKNSIRNGKPLQYIGHNPLGQISVIVLYLSLVVMATTGLIRAGTDIYYPPLGPVFAEYVAQPGVDPGSLVPYDTSAVDKDKYDALQAFKKPFGTVHIYTSYFLMFLVLIHIVAVIRVEIKQGGGIISAMFTGNKVLRDKAQDADDPA